MTANAHKCFKEREIGKQIIDMETHHRLNLDHCNKKIGFCNSKDSETHTVYSFKKCTFSEMASIQNKM